MSDLPLQCGVCKQVHIVHHAVQNATFTCVSCGAQNRILFEAQPQPLGYLLSPLSLLYLSDNNAGICVGFASQFLCFFVTFCKKLSIVSLFLVLIIFPFQHHNKNQNQCVHSSYDPKIESIPNRNRFCCGDDRSRGIGIVGTASRLT